MVPAVPGLSYFDGGMSAVAPQRLRTEGASLRMPQAETPRGSLADAPPGLSADGSAFYAGAPPLSSPRRRPPPRRAPGAVGEGVQPRHATAVFVPADATASGLQRRRNLNVEVYVGQSSLLAGANDASPRQDMASTFGPEPYPMPTPVRPVLSAGLNPVHPAPAGCLRSACSSWWLSPLRRRTTHLMRADRTAVCEA